MSRFAAFLAAFLLMLGPLGFAGLHHSALHSSCEASDDASKTPCQDSGGASEAAQLQTAPCWICTALTHSPGALFDVPSAVTALLGVPILSFPSADTPLAPDLLRPSSRAPPLA